MPISRNCYDDGKILRTHILRPTWHFVAPEDIRWILGLTAPRVQAGSQYYYRQVNLDEATLKKGTKTLAHVLKGGKQLTRKDTAEVYKDASIDTTGLWLGFLLFYAEIEGVICSGAMQGKQHTYALLSERAPEAKDLPRTEALTQLTQRFFTAHGPATIQDFAWWSSLTVIDIKAGIELAKLSQVEVQGKTFYFAKKSPTTLSSPIVHLLPNYDEYGIAYKDRSALMLAKLDRKPTSQELFFHQIILDGQLIGGWKRIPGKTITIQLDLFKELSAQENKALQTTLGQFQAFVQQPIELGTYNQRSSGCRI